MARAKDTTPTASCGLCETVTSRWDDTTSQWVPPLGDAWRAHEPACPNRPKYGRAAA